MTTTIVGNIDALETWRESCRRTVAWSISSPDKLLDRLGWRVSLYYAWGAPRMQLAVVRFGEDLDDTISRVLETDEAQSLLEGKVP